MKKPEKTANKTEAPKKKKPLIEKAKPLSDDQLDGVAGGVASASGPTVGFDGTRTGYGGSARSGSRSPGVDTRDCD